MHVVFDSFIAVIPAFVALKQPARALLDLGRAIMLKPDYAEAYYSKGLVLTTLKRHRVTLNLITITVVRCAVLSPNLLQEAIFDLSQAIAYFPEFINAYHARSINYAAIDSLESAEEDLLKVERVFQSVIVRAARLQYPRLKLFSLCHSF